jgi:hypothetical protein
MSPTTRGGLSVQHLRSAHALRRPAWFPPVIASRFAAHQTIEYSQTLSADPRDGCQLQVMCPLHVFECEEAVMDQGPGSPSCQAVTFPRLGRQPILFER